MGPHPALHIRSLDFLDPLYQAVVGLLCTCINLKKKLRWQSKLLIFIVKIRLLSTSSQSHKRT